MENQNLEIMEFDRSLLSEKMYFRVDTDDFQDKGFQYYDILIVDWIKPLSKGSQIVVSSKGAHHIREVNEDNGWFYIHPEENEIFIPIEITPKVRKSAVTGVIISYIHSI